MKRVSELVKEFERDGLNILDALYRAAEQAAQEFGLDAAVKEVEAAEWAAWDKKQAAREKKQTAARARTEKPPAPEWHETERNGCVQGQPGWP